MKIEEKLSACKRQFLYDGFLEDHYTELGRLYQNKTFMTEIWKVSKTADDALLYGYEVDPIKFREFKTNFCDSFYERLKFSKFPDYKTIYYEVKNSGHSGKSATISVFYALIYMELYEQWKSEIFRKKPGFVQRLLAFKKKIR